MTTSHIIMTKTGGVCEEAAGVSRAVFRCIYVMSAKWRERGLKLSVLGAEVEGLWPRVVTV